MDEIEVPNEPNKWKMPLFVFFKDARNVFKLDALSREILGIALPSALAVSADPIASLIDTAFIGRLGPVELAAAGVSISLFNQASKITIFPLVSITTSFVAEEDTIQKLNTKAAENGNSKAKFGETIVPEDHMLQDMEKGTPKVMNTDAPTEFREEKDESKEYNATATMTQILEMEPIQYASFHPLLAVRRVRTKLERKSDLLLQHQQHYFLAQSLVSFKLQFLYLQPNLC
ncbi:hypothetical protein AAZX31_U029100 [Glycine max]